jgi:hypothetical protein
MMWIVFSIVVLRVDDACTDIEMIGEKSERVKAIRTKIEKRLCIGIILKNKLPKYISPLPLCKIKNIFCCLKYDFSFIFCLVKQKYYASAHKYGIIPTLYINVFYA